MNYQFEAKLWVWSGKGAWYFVTLPVDIAAEIKEVYGANAAGFGSIRVQVTVGSFTWKTSIFRDSQAGSYLLPVKKEVRTAENLRDQDMVRVHISILEAA